MVSTVPTSTTNLSDTQVSPNLFGSVDTVLISGSFVLLLMTLILMPALALLWSVVSACRSRRRRNSAWVDVVNARTQTPRLEEDEALSRRVVTPVGCCHLLSALDQDKDAVGVLTPQAASCTSRSDSGEDIDIDTALAELDAATVGRVDSEDHMAPVGGPLFSSAVAPTTTDYEELESSEATMASYDLGPMTASEFRSGKFEDPGSPTLCPMKHGLTRTISTGHSCDVCGQEVPPRHSLLSCRTCNWDRCKRCTPKETEATSTRPSETDVLTDMDGGVRDLAVKDLVDTHAWLHDLGLGRVAVAMQAAGAESRQDLADLQRDEETWLKFCEGAGLGIRDVKKLEKALGNAPLRLQAWPRVDAKPGDLDMFGVGEQVEAFSEGEWLPGRVETVLGPDMYRLSWLDGFPDDREKLGPLIRRPLDVPSLDFLSPSSVASHGVFTREASRVDAFRSALSPLSLLEPLSQEPLSPATSRPPSPDSPESARGRRFLLANPASPASQEDSHAPLSPQGAQSLAPDAPSWNAPLLFTACCDPDRPPDEDPEYELKPAKGSFMQDSPSGRNPATRSSRVLPNVSRKDLPKLSSWALSGEVTGIRFQDEPERETTDQGSRLSQPKASGKDLPAVNPGSRPSICDSLNLPKLSSWTPSGEVWPDADVNHEVTCSVLPKISGGDLITHRRLAHDFVVGSPDHVQQFNV